MQSATHPAGIDWSDKSNLGKRKFPAEIALLETRKSFRTTAPQSLPLQSLVENLERREMALRSAS